MGAYTGYVTQLFVTDYTLSIIVALPLRFRNYFGWCPDGAPGYTSLRRSPMKTLLSDIWYFYRYAAISKKYLWHSSRTLDIPVLARWPLVNDIESWR